VCHRVRRARRNPTLATRQRLQNGERRPRSDVAEELDIASALRSYEQHGYFEVAGSESGTIYRIHHGTQANVEQLDDLGQPVCAWCFVPMGNLVVGDVMLAQKIALETNEQAAIAIAVKYASLRVRRVAPTRPGLLAS
jgi:hypothetical protein